jgi:hypothetical protein
VIDRYIPGQDAGKRIVPTNPLPNPMSLDIQVGFTWFAEWWRADQNIKEEKERAKHGGRHPSDRVKGEREAREDRDKEKSQIQAAYDSYKADLQIKMSRTFVKQHRGEEWFKERYVAEVRDPLRRRMMDFRRGVYDQWDGLDYLDSRTDFWRQQEPLYARSKFIKKPQSERRLAFLIYSRREAQNCAMTRCRSLHY